MTETTPAATRIARAIAGGKVAWSALKAGTKASAAGYRGLSGKLKGNAPLVVALSAGGYSYITTAGGVASLVKDNWLIGIFVGGAASLAITVAIFAFWTAVFKGNARRSRPWQAFFLFLACSASLVSAGLASGVNSFLMNRESYELEVQQSGVTQMVKPLGALRDTSSRRSIALNDTSARMTRLSTRETGTGDTCQGPPAGPSCGPICRMRQRLAADAAGHSAALQGVSSDATNLMADTGRVLTANQWAELYSKGSALSHDRRTVAALGWARETRSQFSDGFYDKESGQSFICADPQTEANLDGLITLLEEDVGFPAAPPVHAVATISDAVGANMAALGSAIMATFPWGGGYDAAAVNRMMWPFLISVFIELVVVGGLRLHMDEVQTEARGAAGGHAKQRTLPRKWFTLKELHMPQEQLPRARQLLQLALSHTLDDVGLSDQKGRVVPRRYFFMPANGVGNQQTLEWVRQEFGFSPHEIWPGSVGVSRLPKLVSNRLRAIYPDITQVQFFPYTADQDRLLSSLVRAVEGATMSNQIRHKRSAGA